MENWIPFAEGEYRADRAWVLADGGKAVRVEDVLVEVYADGRGQRYLRGRGRAPNILLVELLDESDDLDLLLDFGEEFKYMLKSPNLQGGKVFAPGVKSVLQFSPRIPWQQIPQAEFEALWSRLQILTGQ